MQPITIGVAGGTGSGKTTVVQNILEQVGLNNVAYVSHDSYYRELNHLTLEQRHTINYDHPDALDNDLLIEHIKQLQNMQAIAMPVYDFKISNRTEQTTQVTPQQIVMVDGILLFADKRLRDLMDIKIFVDTDSDLRFIRRLKRDISERGRSTESVIDQYLNTVRPMHLEFVEPTKRYADLIIPEGGFNAVAIQMIAARLKSLIKDTQNK